MKERKFDKGSNILGGLTGLAGSLIGAYNNVNPLDLNTINQARLNAYTVGNTAFGTSSMSGLMDLYNNLPQLLQLSALDIYDPSSKERFSLLFGAGYGTYQGTLALTDSFDLIKKDASQKANGGYIDSIINLAGAGLGMGLNAINNAVLKRKAEEAALRLNILNDFALNRQNHNFNIAVEDTKNNMFNNLAILMMADGGSIYIKPSKRGTFTEAAKRRGLGVLEFASRVLANKENYSSAMVKKANFARNAAKWHAFGGNLSTLGSDWTNGLNWINNGGTHEANPQDGVPMGIAPDGKPNLVEEGEVIFNDDYVFSNRLKVPKVIRDKYKLKDDITFAEAIKKLSKESEERPNDPISLDGLDVFINDLTASQEEVRMKKLANELKQLIANMSPEELQGLQLLMLQQGSELPIFAFGGLTETFDNHKFEDAGTVYTEKDALLAQRYLDQINDTKKLQELINILGLEYAPENNVYNIEDMRNLILGNNRTMLSLKDAIAKSSALKRANEGYYNNSWKTIGIETNATFADKFNAFLLAMDSYSASMIPGRKNGFYQPDPNMNAQDIENNRDYQIFKAVMWSKALNGDREDWWQHYDENDNPDRLGFSIQRAIERLGISKDDFLKEAEKYKDLTKDQALQYLLKLDSRNKSKGSNSVHGSEDLFSYDSEGNLIKDPTSGLPLIYGYMLNDEGKIVQNPEISEDKIEGAFRKYDRLSNDGLGGDYHLYDTFADKGESRRERTIYQDREGNLIEIDPNKISPFIRQTRLDDIIDGNDITHVILLDPEQYRDPETTEVPELREQETLPTWLRYAPVVGSGIGALASMTLEPKDYSTNVSFRQSTFEPIGDYLTYQPVDTLRYINAANQLAAALREAILNASSGNRALALANMATANYTNQQGIAALMNQAELINWPRQVQASEFNRGTNLFNAQAFNLSSLANMALNNLRLNQAQLNANLRRAEDLARDEAISSNLSDLFTNLGNIGTENFNMNMVNENPALYYELIGNGKINYKRKDGGLLTKKNRRK